MSLVLSRTIHDAPIDHNTIVLLLPPGFVVPAEGLEILLHTRDGRRPDQVRVEIDTPTELSIRRGELDPDWRRRRAERRGEADPQ